MSSFGIHYKALMRKNYIMWKRDKWGSCCEVLVPILIACLFFIFRANISRTTIPDESFINLQTKIYPAPPLTPIDIYTMRMINCWTRKKDQSPSFRTGDVALMPNNPITQKLKTIMSTYVSSTGKQFSFQMFNSLEEFNQYIGGDNYNYDICFGVNVEQSGLTYSTTLMFNTTGGLNNIDIANTVGQEEIDYKPQNFKDFYAPYIYYGSLQIKNWIDNVILQYLLSDPTATIEPSITPLKQKSYISDTISDTMKGNISNFVVLPLIVVYLRMNSGILTEKEKKIREGMKIMGMKNNSFYLSWITWYMIIYTLISIVVSIILKLSIYKNSDITLIFVWHWFFCMTLIAQSLFVTTFFTNARLGNIVAMVFFLVMYMIKFIIISSDEISETTNTFVSLASETNLSVSSDIFLLVEAENKGIGWGDLNELVNNSRLGTSLGLLVLNYIVFMVLALYFDQVIPNDFGKKQHPLFCFIWMCKRRNESALHQQMADYEDQSNLLLEQNIEDVAVALKQQEQSNEVLKMNKIYRVYSNGKKAVNGVSLTMYKNQIFCLLGHNGAGKTSLISMLTGMLEFSSGNAQVFGKDIKTEIEEIRQSMGVCPQHDILFPNVSVKEHLEMFAVFKGMDKKDIPLAVEQAIHDVDLKEKTNELSKNLSGGQRRRLSVAIAFIGNSKLIYLDEPTSGMDTSARRHIWDMLKKYKNEKIIVLTTHFMDEADYLGDRIGIMGHGRLICCGSSVFLKNRFGVGYNLSVAKKDNFAKSEPINDLIHKFVPEATKISDVSQEIAFQLPISSVGKFEQLFTEMDNQKQSLGISSYGISITTLEEVFLKVAEYKPQEKQQQQQIPNGAGNTFSAKVLPKDLDNDTKEDQIDNFDLNSVRIKKPIYLFFSHFYALIIKRALYFRRDLRGFICEVFLPCVIVVAGLSLLLISFISNAPILPIPDNLYGNQLSVYWGSDASVSLTDGTSLVSKLNGNILPTHIPTTDISVWDEKNFIDSDHSRKGAYWIYSIGAGYKNFKYYYQVLTIARSTPLYFMNEMNQAAIRLATSQDIVLKVTNMPLRLTKRAFSLQSSANGIVGSFMFSIALAFIPASLITYIVKERETMVKHQHMVSGVTLLSYWSSSFTIDFLKHIVPSFFCMLMVLAFSIETFTLHTSDYAAISILFFLYGWAVIPFSYLTGFLFRDYGNAQVTNFFVHFILGGIGPLTMFVLRVTDMKSISIAIGWALRLIPSFSFGYGVINIGNRANYALKEGIQTPYGTFNMDIAGGDVLFLSLEGVIYMLLVFLYENLSQKKGFSQLISGENKVLYVPKELDDDVQLEAETIAKSSPSEYTVCVKELRKVFVPDKKRVKVAVDNISFGIKKGELFTLLGVNGAGKTTTFKILSGEIKPTSGEAHIAGFSVINQLDQARMNIGYCPQFDALLDNLTAREHLNLYAAIKGIPNNLRKRLVEKRLIEMDLIQFEGILAGSFSGGNKRKLSVAIAMLGNPSIIFLDEPSTGMDPGARRFMWNVISRISSVNKNSSVILTTHSMEEAEALSTRMAIQVDGLLHCIGTTQQIKHKFGKGYEVEVKIQKSTPEELLALAQKAGLQGLNVRIFPKDIEEILKRLNSLDLLSTIAEGQTGYILYKDMTSPKGLLAEVLLDYIVIEGLGHKIMSFLNESFGFFDIIEHLSDFYRFRIETGISIGKIFGQFEFHKAALKISEYSLKQASIEQIFNMFAEGKIEVNQHLKKNQMNTQKAIQKQEIQLNGISQEQHQKMIPERDIEMQNNNIPSEESQQ